ncbi:MAG: hypothetical protein JRH16_13745 [Deltaproteobacteria bacterium]|nr:hypothetical protein [Deltaproteobacteria bacterium]
MPEHPVARTPFLTVLYLLAGLLFSQVFSQQASAACDCSVLPTLGRAAEYPAFGLDGVAVLLQGSAFAENGNIGVGDGGSAELQGSAAIDGYIEHHPGATVIDGHKAAGGVTAVDMTGAVADAIAASATFAAMSATQTFSGIDNQVTVTGNGCINVIQVNGDIDLRGNDILRFKGGPEDYFVVNVDGFIETRGTTDIVLDGLEPNQVIFNITKPGAAVNLGGNSGGYGTFLNVAGEIYLHGNSGGRGAYIAGLTRLELQGDVQYYGQPFGCAAAVASSACDCNALPTLGAALGFPAMSIFKDVNISGSAWADNGNIGLGNDQGNDGKVSISGDADIDGFIGHHSGTSVDISSGTVHGGVTQMDMSDPVDDVKAASVALAALAPTQTISSITSSRTITGNGCVNVIRVNNEISLGSGTLTLEGGGDDYFIVNVSKGISIGGDGAIVLDGVMPQHVIFNLVGGGDDVSLSGSADVWGTFVNVDKGISVSGDATNRGAYYAGETLSLSGEATFYGNPFYCEPPEPPAGICADPSATGINIETPATPSGRSTGNTPFYFGYFDTSSYEGHLESYRMTADGTLKDKVNVDAIDSSTSKFESTRTPYWDAGLLLRSDSSRDVYTTIGGVRVDFDTSNVTDVDLDVTAAEVSSYPNHPASGVTNLTNLRDAIVAYIHGKDAFDEDGDSIKGEMRSAVLGDIFHSNIQFVGTPTTILMHEDGYADFHTAYEQRDRVVYAGANDALLHAFDAGAWWNPSDASAFNAGTGEELFGYVPGLVLPIAKLTPKVLDSTGARLVPGFVDGNMSAADAWLGDGSGTDTTKSASEWATVLVVAFREGGRGYLALDITDPTAMSAPHGPYPKLLWEFTSSNMGQSWSKPVISRVKVKGVGASGDHCGIDDGDGDCREQWVAIVGGGFERTGDPNDPDYLGDPTSLAWKGESKAIYMIALDTGAVLASVEFDAAGTSGPSAMKYSLPSEPAVLDLNGDRFADVVYIGDLGGQLWKWDISTVGEDSDADTKIDTWNSGVFFDAARADMGGGQYHYRSLYNPPSASYSNGVLMLAFGTGEDRDRQYAGDASKDDNNRFYVVRDLHPTGSSAFASTATESNLSDVTSTGLYADPGNVGYYIVGEESEKFITDPLIFASHVLVASYKPDTSGSCGPGESFFYAFEVSNGKGFFDANATPEASDRRMLIGAGIPSNPRISIGHVPTDDVLVVQTSEGEVLTIEPPLRDPPSTSMIYWRQRF